MGDQRTGSLHHSFTELKRSFDESLAWLILEISDAWWYVPKKSDRITDDI